MINGAYTLEQSGPYNIKIMPMDIIVPVDKIKFHYLNTECKLDPENRLRMVGWKYSEIQGVGGMFLNE